jgi:hypothetical protein
MSCSCRPPLRMTGCRGDPPRLSMPVSHGRPQEPCNLTPRPATIIVTVRGARRSTSIPFRSATRQQPPSAWPARVSRRPRPPRLRRRDRPVRFRGPAYRPALAPVPVALPQAGRPTAAQPPGVGPSPRTPRCMPHTPPCRIHRVAPDGSPTATTARTLVRAVAAVEHRRRRAAQQTAVVRASCSAGFSFRLDVIPGAPPMRSRMLDQRDPPADVDEPEHEDTRGDVRDDRAVVATILATNGRHPGTDTRPRRQRARDGPEGVGSRRWRGQRTPDPSIVPRARGDTVVHRRQT